VEVRTNYRPASKALEDYLKVKPIGTFIGFPELCKVADVDILAPNRRYILEAARRALLKHHDRVLVSVRGEGYQVADLNQTLSASAGYRKRSYKAAKSAFETVKTIDLSKLDEKEKYQVIKEQAKSACMLTIYKATENQAINDGTGKVTISNPSEGDILRLLLQKS
jgi:GH25 family lysozyme M1 (1,4-beta-N-acetylmuramidase)